MRRTLAAAAVLAVAASLGSTALAQADDATGSTTDPVSEAGANTEPTTAEAVDALQTAERVMDGDARTGDPSPTIALRDLRLARSALSAAGVAAADRLLAPPTARSKAAWASKCNQNLCLHWKKSGSDAPPSTKWAKKSFGQMVKVWKFETGSMGYRRPPSDHGQIGPNGKFDVILMDVGAQGYYGYCTTSTGKKVSPSYCVLDNDFVGFPTPPLGSLKVTAAHEFFHSIQFGYDSHEAAWVMENTATWMEERYADSVDDNRNYLPYGQIANPGQSLTKFGQLAQYGNWTFWEYWSQHRGNGVVKDLWKKMAKTDALKATQQVIGRHGGFTTNFSRYASALLTPALSWSEGAAYPVPSLPSATLTQASPTSSLKKATVKHLAARSAVYYPGGNLTDPTWRLRVKAHFTGLSGKQGASAILTVDRNGAIERVPVKLNGSGRGQVSVDFVSGAVTSVSVSLVNASTTKDKPAELTVSAFQP